MTIADPDPDAHEFSERLTAFFQGEALERPAGGLSLGPSADEYRQRRLAEGEALLAELDDTGQEVQAAAQEDMPDTEAEEPAFERIDHTSALTPYDKARQRLREAEIQRDAVEPGSDGYHRVMADVAEAARAVRVEQERATDEGWRKRRATDEWRAGEGRDEYNASRRKVRSKPNARTPKTVLDAMTPEERAQYDRDKNAEKVWKHGRRKAGWSAEKIEAELPDWWKRRLAKRSCG
ncbi:hypothetical protein K3718_10765 [Leisingera aquaemixtae]|uniref:Uncharacterized protein n=1 Tax=Leisingera aquaemixtae TaxID=1396826 RepID=A0ABY5WF13_9RHOB|nr:hypothetical protein [Leisingera aquaemixtae]UWQ40056.1 hypothetical protein K3718_10765 [Leisingera aquaemixtae]